MNRIKNSLKIVASLVVLAVLITLAGCDENHRHGMSYSRPYSPQRYEARGSSSHGSWHGDARGHDGHGGWR